MLTTTTIGLKKPEDTDNADLNVFIGDNMDAIDVQFVIINQRNLYSDNSMLLTDTAEHTIVSFTPSGGQINAAYIFFRILNATTNVTIKVNYTYASVVQTTIVLNAQSCPVGEYSCLPVFMNPDAFPITITATASIANNLFISGLIRRV